MLASAQDVENARQLCSQSFELLDVPIKYASSFKFPAALLDDHFEHPENRPPIVSHGPLVVASPLVIHETQYNISTGSCHSVHCRQ
jgi:hypothetical protein